MSDSLAVLNAGADYRLAEFLSRRKASAYLVMPEPLLKAIRQLAPSAEWSGTPSLDSAVVAGKKRLFVYDPHREAALLTEARSRFPRLEVLGLLHHVIPRLACSPHGRQGEMTAKPAPRLPGHRYAVVCTARTGSTFFCELLQAAGLGLPLEHLRPALVHVLRRPGVDREAVYDELLRCGQRPEAHGGVFGTKLISHFLLDAVGHDALEPTLLCLLERGFRFIHLQRDLVQQAVSKFTAKHTDLWHVRGQVSERHRDRIAQVVYDAAQLRDLYRQVRRETEEIEAALAGLPDSAVLRANYDHFTTQPLEALRAAAAHLGLPVDEAGVAGATLPVAISAAAPEMRTWVERLRADLATQSSSAA